MWYSIIRPVNAGIIRNELEPALQALPGWRRDRALSYRFDRDRYTCAKAYLLLKELLTIHYGIRDDVEFSYGPYGKPFLKSFPGIHFNFSHCPKAVFCAVGDIPLGVDVEEFQNDEAVAGQVFSDEECRSIRIAGSPETAFTQLWTQKEAYLKLLGTGLTDDLKGLLEHPERPAVFRTEVDVGGGFVSSVATFV